MEKIDVAIDYSDCKQFSDFAISIYRDLEAETPRTWDNLGTICCFGKYTHLGDSHNFKSPQELNAFIKEHKAVALPVYMLSHSGETVSTRPFSDPFDSGQIGMIYVTAEKITQEYGKDDEETRALVENVLRNEIENLDTWLSGDIYGYIIEKNGEQFRDAACWGFYTLEECVQEAIDQYKYLGEEFSSKEAIKKHIARDVKYYLDLPEVCQTADIAECYLKNGGQLHKVSSKLQKEMGLSVHFADGSVYEEANSPGM